MTIFGWDMSHFDAPGIGAAVAEGFSFITHKAGGDANDAELGAWWAGVRNLPADQVLLGAYWVLYPGGPTARADRFLARLDDQCPGWRNRPFILQADCEIWGGDVSTRPGRSDIRAFCDRLVDRVPKLRPVVYAPKWAYGDSLTGLGYPLWASSYVNGTGPAARLYPGDTSPRWGAYSGQTPAILQFTSSATIAGQSTCDANAYRGTLAELIALVAPGWEVDMPLSDVEIDKIAAKVAGYPIKSPDGSTTWSLASYARNAYVEAKNGRLQADRILPAVQAAAAAAGADDTDEQAIAAAVAASITPDRLAAGFKAAGWSPEGLAAAIPPDLAEQVVEILTQRLAA